MQQQNGPTAGVSRRKLFGVAGLGGAAVLMAACGNITTPVGKGAGASLGTAGTALAASSTSATAAQREAWLYLTIAVVQKGGTDWPEYVPSLFTVPANATVHVELRDFDTGPAPIPAGYEQVKGTTSGAATLLPSVSGDLSAVKSQTVQSVDAKQVAHTFTIPDLGLNIPSLPQTTMRFTFATGAPGTHDWQCFAACGTGASGWSGPMADMGFMQGKMTVVA